jgi:hypothetical protein
MTRFIQEFLRQSNELLEELHRNPRVTYLDLHLLETQVHIFQFEPLKIKQEKHLGLDERPLKSLPTKANSSYGSIKKKDKS